MDSEPRAAPALTKELSPPATRGADHVAAPVCQDPIVASVLRSSPPPFRRPSPRPTHRLSPRPNAPGRAPPALQPPPNPPAAAAETTASSDTTASTPHPSPSASPAPR